MLVVSRRRCLMLRDLRSVAVLVNCATSLVCLTRLQKYGLIAERADWSEFLGSCHGDPSIDRASINRVNNGRTNRLPGDHWVNHHSVNHHRVNRVK
jgi:hypothetical protein